MGKIREAAYVMFMPKRCADCIFRCSPPNVEPFCYGKFKKVTDDEYYKQKPDWCPLHEMPERKSGANDYEKGWNDCLNKILNND